MLRVVSIVVTMQIGVAVAGSKQLIPVAFHIIALIVPIKQAILLVEL
jgi:hypothetical protein